MIATNHQTVIIVCVFIAIGVLAAVYYNATRPADPDPNLVDLAAGDYQFVVDPIAPADTTSSAPAASAASPTTGAPVIENLLGHKVVEREVAEKHEEKPVERAAGLEKVKSIFGEVNRVLIDKSPAKKEEKLAAKTLAEAASANDKGDAPPAKAEAPRNDKALIEIIPSDDVVDTTADKFRRMTKKESDDAKARAMPAMATLISNFQSALKDMFATVSVEPAPNKKGFYLKDPDTQKCIDVKSYVALVNAVIKLQLGTHAELPDRFTHDEVAALNAGDASALKQALLRECNGETVLKADATGDVYVSGKPLRMDVLWPTDSSLVHTSALRIVKQESAGA